jgi:hypothetical protein
MSKFHGSLDQLRAVVDATGSVGDWRDIPSGHSFRANTGEVINWWLNKGTISCQGPKPIEFQAELDRILDGGVTAVHNAIKRRRFSLFMGMTEMQGINLSLFCTAWA